MAVMGVFLWLILAFCVKKYENWQLSKPAPKRGEWYLNNRF